MEDFTTYTEFEDAGDTLSVDSATQITFTGLTRDEDAYVYKDKGANQFHDDFEFLIDLKITGRVNQPQVYFATLANTVDEARAIQVNAGESALTCMVYHDTVSYLLYLREFDGADSYNDSWNALAENTQYYLRFKRDESVGAFGTIYLDAYTSDADRTNEDNAVANLSVALHSSKKDFRYIYAVQSYDTDNGGYNISGVINNLDLQMAPTGALYGSLVGPFGGPMGPMGGRL